MEQFLDMSPRHLFEQYANLLEALYRSYDKLQTMLDMVFPACVVKIFECQFLTFADIIKEGYDKIRSPGYIMTEEFFEIHYPKITEEYKLYRAID